MVIIRDMQNENYTYHLTPVKMAIIKKATDSKWSTGK